MPGLPRRVLFASRPCTVISPSFGAGLPLTILGGLESPENSRREAAGKGSDNGLPGWPRTAVLKDCAWNLDFSPYRAERRTAGFFSSSPGTNAFAGSRGENLRVVVPEKTRQDGKLEVRLSEEGPGRMGLSPLSQLLESVLPGS